MINSKYNTTQHTLFASILWLALAGVSLYLISLFVSPNQIHAQVGTGPFDEENKVTATVPDHTAPSKPILIEPENNVILNTARPTLIWKESSDDVAVAHYTLYLDGEVWFDNLPLNDNETDEYKYTYDPDTDYYSLTPKNILENSTFTWKVGVTDTSDNSSESVTWSFSIDTHAPSFIIENIGTKDTSISAKDLNTLPEEPVTLSENEPLLTGTGENASSVNVTITTPSETATDSYNIDSNGNWELQLGILPRGETIYLDFVITDEAGNTSVLLDVPILITKEVIVIPPTSPGVVPSPEPSPPISIPDLSPKEWRQEIIKTVDGFLPLSLKEYSAEKLIQVPTEPEPTRSILELVGFLIIALPPIVGFLLLVSMFAPHLSLNSLPLLASLAGLIPTKKEYNGVVFAGETGEAIPYARVVFSGITAENERIHAQTITDAQGFFKAPLLPNGNYVCSALHPSCNFPTHFTRENNLSFRDFYSGEKFTVTSDQVAQQLCIPLDVATKTLPFSYRLLEELQFGTFISWASFVIASIITLLYPSIWNIIAIGLFLAIGLVKLLYNSFQPQGIVISENKEPVRKAILRFINTQTGNTIWLTKTDAHGEYRYQKFAQLPEHDEHNQVVFIKHGWHLHAIESPDIIATPTSN